MLKARRPVDHRGSPRWGYARLKFEKESVFTSYLGYQKGHRSQHHRGDTRWIGWGGGGEYGTVLITGWENQFDNYDYNDGR